MFDNFSQKLSRAVLVFIAIGLSAVFATTFGGPQAEGCNPSGPALAAKVYGTALTPGDYRAAYSLARFDQQPPEVAERNELGLHALNGLVERALLAHAAEELGYAVETEDVVEMIQQRGMALLSMSVNAPSNLPSGEVPLPVMDQDGNYDEDAAKSYIQFGLNRSISEFVESQRQEMLAQRMRDTVLANVVVSPREVWEAYVREQDTAKIKFIRFTSDHYQENLDASEANIRAWMAENAEAVDREYEAQAHRYTGLEKQVRARHILISAAEDAPEEEKTAARAKAEGLLVRARAGEDFASLARDNSDDEGSARRDGDLGYNAQGRMVPQFDEAQFGMEIDEISDLVETRYGFHIIKVVGVREGDVPVDEAKLELSEGLFRTARARELAEESARRALGQLNDGQSWESVEALALGRPDPELAVEIPEEPVAPIDPENPDAQPAEEEEEPPPPGSPQVEESRHFGRSDVPIPGVDNGPLVRAVFEMEEEGTLGDEPIQLGNDWVVYQLAERSRATEEDFSDATRARLTDGLSRAKRREALALYVNRLRSEAEEAREIEVNLAVLTNRNGQPEPEEDDEEEEEEE